MCLQFNMINMINMINIWCNFEKKKIELWENLLFTT